MTGELHTIKDLIQSNNSFYSAINNCSIELDTNVRFELMLLYFRVNYQHLLDLKLPNSEDLEDIIKYNDYTIEDGFIVRKGKKYYPEYFKYIIDLLEETKVVKPTEITPFTRTRSNVIRLQREPAQIVSLKPYLQSSKESREYFETSATLDEYSKPYINSVQRKFRNNFSDTIVNILEGTEVSPSDLLFAYSMVNLYPYIYGNDKFPSIIKSIQLPQNAIGLRKTTYKQEVLKDYNAEMARISEKRENLYRAQRAFELSNSMTPLREQYINGCLNRLQEDEYNAQLERYFHIHTNEVYNSNLLHYLIKSIDNGMIDFNYDSSNPVIKFFYISSLGEVEFHSSMRLDTFSQLLDNEEALKVIDSEKEVTYTKR